MCAAAGLFLACMPAYALADEAPRPLDDRPISVRADHVGFYSDLAAVVARGNANVTLPDGATVSGDTFAMDLRLHRLVVAGHVMLHSSAGDFAGAALADFLQYGRVYFVPLDPAADRWTFLESDYAHPQKGRQMPGDAFFLIDVSGRRPYVAGKSALIDPAAFVRFEPAAVHVLNVVETPPLPTFVYNYSPNPSFGQNSMPGATVDAPYNFYGTAHSLEAFHFRYDQALAVKTYGAYEHHSVWGDEGYAVFSLVPATEPRKQWNLFAYDSVGSRDAWALTAQLFTTQFGLAAPTTSSGFVDAQFVHALPQSSLHFDLTQSYGSLLSSGPPNHPVIAGLTWTSDGERIGSSGITLRLDSGTALAHDSYGVSGSALSNVTSSHIGATIASPVYSGPLGTAINTTYTVRRTWLSFPNVVDASTFTSSAGKRVADRLFTTASLTVAAVSARNLTDVLVSPNLTTGLTPAPLSPNGLPVFTVPTVYPQTVARIYSLTTSWQPSTDFQISTAIQKDVYSPVQLPSPYQLVATMRTRISRSLFITLTRTYSFNYQGQRWSPQFVLQVTGQ